MRVQIVFSLLLIEAFLFGVHFFVYASLASLFPSLVSSHRTVVMSALAFLAVSFIIALALLHVRENLLTRIFYFLSGWWLGFLVNLVLALLAMLIIRGIAGLVPIAIPVASLGVVFIGCAILVSFCGTWNAFHPRLHEITVRIPDLPEAWQGKKIVQLSDVHLGSIYRADFLRSVVSQVNSAHPEAVVITGDLFDSMDGVLTGLVQPLDGIESRYGTFFVTGNHETYLGGDKVFAALGRTKVKIIDNAVVDLGGLRLIGIAYPPLGGSENIAQALAALQPEFLGQPNVLLFHAPTHIDEFRAAGINLQLSGHTHVGQQFPFNLVTSAIYHGFDYGLHELGDYSIYTTNGVGTWGPAMRIGNTPEIVVVTLERK